LATVLPYAERRAEDLDEHKAAGNEDSEFPGAIEAARAREDAERLVEQCRQAGLIPSRYPTPADALAGALSNYAFAPGIAGTYGVDRVERATKALSAFASKSNRVESGPVDLSTMMAVLREYVREPDIGERYGANYYAAAAQVLAELDGPEAYGRRVKACLRTCADVPTDQLGDVSLAELGAAVAVVLDRWEGGDLAEAIRDLQAVAEPILPAEAPADAPTP
jgi:hypothetical protein